MKKISVVLGFFVVMVLKTPCTAQAPLFQWAKTLPIAIPSAFGYIAAYVTDADPDGGAAVCGLRDYVSKYYLGTLQLAHFNASGVLGWTKLMNGDASVSSLKYTKDKHIIVSGVYYDSLRFSPTQLLLSPPPASGWPYHFLASFDSLGNVLWYRGLESFLGPIAGSGKVPIAVDVSGNVYIAYASDVPLSDTIFIRKINAAGTLVSTISQNARNVTSVAVDASGNIYAAGGCASNSGNRYGNRTITPNVGGAGYNRYLVRYRPDGTPSWVNFSRDVTCPDAQVVCFNANTIYWAGDIIDTSTFGSFHLQGPPDGSTGDFHLLRLDSNGTYQWAQEVPGNVHGAGVRLSTLNLDDSGNVYIGGAQTNSITWNSSVQSSANGNMSDPVVLRYSPSGTIAWAKTAGSSIADAVNGLGIDHYGAVYIAGSSKNTIRFDSDSITSTTGAPYPFIAKLGAGNAIPANIVASAERAANGFIVYPNPANDLLRLSFDKPLTVVGTFQIRDITGRVVVAGRLEAGIHDRDIQLRHLSPGSYWLSISTGSVMATARITRL